MLHLLDTGNGQDEMKEEGGACRGKREDRSALRCDDFPKEKAGYRKTFVRTGGTAALTYLASE